MLALLTINEKHFRIKIFLFCWFITGFGFMGFRFGSARHFCLFIGSELFFLFCLMSTAFSFGG